MRDLGTLGGATSQAYALTSNTIVGCSDTGAGAPHATLFALDSSGAVTTRTDLNGAANGYSYAYAANSRGQVVGTNGHAVLWQSGAMLDLNKLLPPDSGWVLKTATGINDEGQIIGNGSFYGFPQGFLLRRVASSTVANVSAANYLTRHAPEAIASAFGQNLAMTTQAASTSALPTTLGGTQVLVRDSAGMTRPAPLFFVSPSQVNFLMPTGTTNGVADVFITNASEVLSFGTAQLANIAPGLFSFDANGRGIAAAVALRIKADGSQNYESLARFDTVQSKYVSIPLDLGPATDQVYLLLFGTGVRGRTNLANVNIKIKNIESQIGFAGSQGALTGLDQVNVLLPHSLTGSGEADIRLTVDGLTANVVSLNIK
jgi:uncharacterized protein (TIGR03437 family)